MPITCPRCGNTEHFQDQPPPRDHLLVCTDCGACDLDPSGDPTGSQPVEVAPGEGFNPGTEKKPSGYQRKAHVMERLSQALCREPRIASEVLDKITAEIVSIGLADPDFEGRRSGGKLDKKDVQRVLRSLNKKEGVNWYTTKYLEKWKSIRQHVFKEETLIGEQDLIRLGYTVTLFSNLWDAWKADGRYPERAHFPNFNYVFTRVAELLKIAIPQKEFPLPSAKCIDKLKPYVDAMAKDLDFE